MRRMPKAFFITMTFKPFFCETPIVVQSYQQVASKLGTDPKKIQLRMVNGAVANGEVPMRLPRELGLLVDVMEPAENFKNRVINAVVVA